MIDNPEKAQVLIEELEAALPFEARLPASSIKFLRLQKVSPIPPSHLVVSKIHYMGDEGGIACEIEAGEGRQLIVLSITHLRFRPSQPFARSVKAYQKHRVKGLKKQNLKAGFL